MPCGGSRVDFQSNRRRRAEHMWAHRCSAVWHGELNIYMYVNKEYICSRKRDRQQHCQYKYLTIFFSYMISKCDLTDDMSADCWSHRALCVRQPNSPFISLTEMYISSSNSKCCLWEIISFIQCTTFFKREDSCHCLFQYDFGCCWTWSCANNRKLETPAATPAADKGALPTFHAEVFTGLINVVFIITQRRTPAGRGNTLIHIFLVVFGSSSG